MFVTLTFLADWYMLVRPLVWGSTVARVARFRSSQRRSQMRKKIVPMVAIVLAVLFNTTAGAQTKIQHPHDREFERLLDGDIESIALHWSLGEKLGKENAETYWEEKFAYTCRYIVRCSQRRLKMPTWVHYPHNKRADEPSIEDFQSGADTAVTSVRLHMGALFALLYTLEHTEHFDTKNARARVKAGEKLIEYVRSNAWFREDMSKLAPKSTPDSSLYTEAEQLAWIEHRSGLSTVHSRLFALTFYQILIENRQYERAALIACRYNLGLEALRNAADMVPEVEEELVGPDPRGVHSWSEWKVLAIQTLEKGQSCSDELWRDRAPMITRYQRPR